MVNAAIPFTAIRRRRIKKMLQSGAFVLDIRSTEDFAKGHVDGAFNIPKDLIEANLATLRQLNAPLLVCGTLVWNGIKTVNLLRSHGMRVYNGGNWRFVSRVKSSL